MPPSIRTTWKQMRMTSSAGRRQHPEDEGARFQAAISHLRDNISRAIESDVRDFGRNSHLPCQSLCPSREEESKLPGAVLVVRTRSEPSQSCQKANLARRFTRHCVNSGFTGFLRSDISSSPPGTSDQAANRPRNFAWPLEAAKASSRYRSSPDQTSAGRPRSRSSAASAQRCR
jgi:hypothetical protein